MQLNKLDTRLNLQIDSYLKSFEAFNFLDDLLKTYNKQIEDRENSIIDLRDKLFYTKYQKIYNLLSVLSFNKANIDIDNTELMFISNIVYKQKGSLESIKTILNIIDCEYDDKDLYIDENLKLHMKISFKDVKEIYLASKYLQQLCQDLLFYDDYGVIIDSMSVRYVLNGNINKRYAVYNVYDLLSTSNVTSTETVKIKNEIDINEVKTDYKNQLKELTGVTIDDETDITDFTEILGVRTLEDGKGTETKKVSYSKDIESDTYFKTITTTTETFNEISTMTIDTYEW